MLKTAFTVGQLDAFEAFGLEKTALNARLMGTLAGGALGAMAAPEGEGLQGAILGGGAGYLGGAGVSRGVNAAKGLATRATDLMSGGGQSLIGNLDRIHMVSPTLNQRPVTRQLDSDKPRWTRRDASLPAEWPMFQGTRQPAKAAPTASNAAPMSPKQRQEAVEKAGTELGISGGIPGTPFGASVRSREERLPGMHRWVPRDVIEKAYEGLDQGLDPQAILEESADEGRFTQPLLGAGAGAAAMHFGLPKSGIAGKGLGALLGGGVGAIFNQATSPHRQRDMGEALSGVLKEQGIIQGQNAETASEPAPMLVARGGNEG